MRKSLKKKGKPMDEIVIERRVHWNRQAVKPAKAPETKAVAVRTPPRPAQTTKVNGAENKHAVNFRRPLNEREEAVIRREFLKLNGVFEPNKKDCTRIKGLLGDEVSVFQVSGFVTKLHAQAVSGTLEMKDRRAYLSTLRTHRSHWLTYTGEKYDEMRERAEANGRKPVFAARASRESVPTPRHKVVR